MDINSNLSSPTGSVLLLSGGIESATLLRLEHRRTQVWPLFVDYGQRAAARERACARAQCSALDLELKELDMAAVGEGFRAGQSHKLHVPLPHRNLPILSLALSYAAQCGARSLALALNREDLHAYPSAGEPFLAQFAALAQTLQGCDLRLPLMHLDKAAIVRLGIELGVDYGQSYSCLLGYERQCGACPQCEKRRAAFAAAGVDDPAGYAR